MIPKHLEAEALRLWHVEKWRVGTIATQLGIHHSAVRRVLAQDGQESGRTFLRPILADAYLPFMRETLEKYPKLTASRLHQMVRERGYTGAPDHFRAIVARIRPRPPAEAYLRLRTLIGEQAQVDWGHFGAVTIGKAKRRLYGFVMVLSWSRQIFLRFYLGHDHTANFLRGHADAFSYFSGVPRVMLYDNLKSAVIERVREAIHFNDALLAFAAHYRYEPRPVAVARGNEKGRVERSIRYIRESFFAARKWEGIDDLNEQALAWCSGIAADRKCPEDRSLTVRESFAQERERLLALPEHPYPIDERTEVKVGKTPYVRFDLNDYSVPHTYVRRTLVVVASLDTVRILDGNEVIATHPRSFDQAQQIETPGHIQALVEQKREATAGRGIDRLHHAVPGVQTLFNLAAERGGNLGGLTSGLLKLLDLYGAESLQGAVGDAIAAGAPHLAAVRQTLERRRREMGEAPPVAIPLPDDPRVRGLVVRPHALQSYDALGAQAVTP